MTPPAASGRGLRPVVAVVGPTAAGKASLGRLVAQRLEQPVLVCDSVKVYRGLDVGSAKPDARAVAEVPHHLVDLVDPDYAFSAGDYAAAAWRRLENGGGVFVGGTGFYLRTTAWTQTRQKGAVAPSMRDPQRVSFDRALRAAERAEAGFAYRALAAEDPLTAASIHPHNFERIERALWHCRVGGGPISRARQADPPRPRLSLLLLILDPGPDRVAARIEARVDRMLEAGWLAEVERLAAAGYDARHKAMQSVGYKQLLDVVEGRIDLPTARKAIIIATRQLARRQRTFIRHQFPGARKLALSDASETPWDEVEAFARFPGDSP